MFHDISWNMGALVSSWVVGPLYGSVCVFVLCLRVLHLKGLRGTNLTLFITAIVQFCLSTGHVITLLVQLIRGFITSAGTVDGPTLYFLDQATPEHIAQELLYITNSLIGDAILIWRLYIIWNRNIRLASPFVVLCIATGVCGYTAVANVARLSATGSIFVARIHNWLLATWVLSIATQLGATLLIAHKIWASAFGARAVLWILVESGAAYSATTLFLLGFSRTATGAIFAAALGQISAIAPTLVVVRAADRAKGYGGDGDSCATRRGGFGVGSGGGDDGVRVHVTRGTHVHLDGIPGLEQDVSFHPLYPPPKGMPDEEAEVSKTGQYRHRMDGYACRLW
ncbi:hypothetical protein BV25DRAFT_410707 [Artomyces pyxidatus]|uniref:Uncharacterized protein n=1 Tax=Artomyces pyxidatus TaxID=48021 RepID=A0ACB8T3E3_9AGAM|nr:hypothetical protein BV25DRAFT_410707 [Artomyces pyxidatus]